MLLDVEDSVVPFSVTDHCEPAGRPVSLNWSEYCSSENLMLTVTVDPFTVKVPLTGLGSNRVLPVDTE